MQVKTKNIWKGNEGSNELLEKHYQHETLLKLKTRCVTIPYSVKLNSAWEKKFKPEKKVLINIEYLSVFTCSVKLSNL